MRCVVLGIDGQGKAFDGAQVERAYLFHMALFGGHLQFFDFNALFLLLQPAQVELK